VVTSNKPPPDLPTDATSFQRLSQQAEAEVALFKSEPADTAKGKILRALFDDGHATTGALITQLSTMYSTFLNETWAPSTFLQIYERISVLTYEIAMLGSPGAQAVEDAVGAEVDLRLNKYLPSYYMTFNATIVNPYNDKCKSLITQLTSMSAGEHTHAVEFIARLDTEKKRVQNELKTITDSMLGNARDFWVKAFRDILTARYRLDEKTLKYVMKVNGTEPEQTKVFPSLSYFLGKIFQTKKEAMKEASAKPPFQLAEYPKYVESIVSTLDTKLDLQMNDVRNMVHDMIELVDYVITQTRSIPLLSLAFQQDFTQATVTANEHISYDFCVALLKFTPCMAEMLKVRTQGTGHRVGDEREASFDVRKSKEGEVNELCTAHDAIRDALGWDEKGLNDMFDKAGSAGGYRLLLTARDAIRDALSAEHTRANVLQQEIDQEAESKGKGKGKGKGKAQRK